jgi:ribosomal protein L34
MQTLARLLLPLVLIFSVVVGALAQEADQNWQKEPSQEAPKQAKQEAEKPDTKALSWRPRQSCSEPRRQSYQCARGECHGFQHRTMTASGRAIRISVRWSRVLNER